MSRDIILESAELESLLNNASGQAQLLTVYSRVYESDVATLNTAVDFIDQQDSINLLISKIKNVITKDMEDIATAEDLLIQSDATLAAGFSMNEGEN